MWHDEPDDPWVTPTLGVLIVAALGCAIFFWLPLFLYAWHWWIR